jgi:hypothetical protein
MQGQGSAYQGEDRRREQPTRTPLVCRGEDRRREQPIRTPRTQRRDLACLSVYTRFEEAVLPHFAGVQSLDCRDATRSL